MKKLTFSRVRFALTTALLITLVFGMRPIDEAQAASFTVNSRLDAPDANPGDGVCKTVDGGCTLRAAIDEANATPGTDLINAPIGAPPQVPFVGTYLLNDQLVIEDSVILNGAGPKITILDGQGLTEVLRIKTVETLVCDSRKDNVASYDRNGQRNLDYFGSGLGGIDQPIALTEGPTDSGLRRDIFVAGFTSGIHRYDAQTGAHKGLFVPSNGGGSPLGPTDLVFPPLSVADGHLLVTNYQLGGGIRRFDRRTGAFIDNFIPAGSGGLALPSSIEIHDGDIYVTSTFTNEVLQYNGKTGAFINNFVPGSGGGLRTPRDLLFSGDFLYVASEEDDAVLRYNANTGLFDRQFITRGNGGLDKPTEIAFGPDGNFYVLSSGTKQILRYDGETGAFIDIFIEETSDIFLGTPACLVFRDFFGQGPAVHISGLTLANGDASFIGSSGSGLFVDRGSFTSLNDATVRDHGGSTFGAGISNRGNLTLRRVEVTGNKMPAGGGGQTSNGGGIFNSGFLDIEDSLVFDNFATRGGGIDNNGGNISIINTTISGNRALGGGGGIRNAGNGAQINISFSTITENLANQRCNRGEPNCTEDRANQGCSGERNCFGGGVINFSPARISMGNTILAKNSDSRTKGQADFSPDCYSPDMSVFASERDNLVGVLTDNCVLRDFSAGTTAFIDFGTPNSPLDPALFGLANNGGSTRTHELMDGSPAIDRDVSVTSARFFDCPNIDQRGFTRPVDGSGNGTAECDIGSFEFGAKLLRFTDEERACPLDDQAGRIIVEFPEDVVLTTRKQSDNSFGPLKVDIPSGTYNITLVSFDDHIQQPQEEDQKAESWFLQAQDEKGDIVFESNPISDLPKAQNILEELVQEHALITQDLTGLSAKHILDIGGSDTAESVWPVCAAFDKVKEDNDQ